MNGLEEWKTNDLENKNKKMIDMGIGEIKKNGNIKGKIKNLNFSHTSHFFGACLRSTSVKKNNFVLMSQLFKWHVY